MRDIEYAITEDGPVGASHYDLSFDRFETSKPPPMNPEVAKRLDEHAERVRKERERRQWLRESGW